MNYAAFEWMQTGALSRLENEPEQDYMTRVFREICPVTVSVGRTHPAVSTASTTCSHRP